MSKIIGRGRYATSTYPGRDASGAPVPVIPDDHKILVDGSDTTPGFLGVKVAQGGNVQLTILNPGGDEQLEISVPNADHKFSINGADATADFAEQKLVPGANMAVTVVDLGGGNLVLSFAAVVPAGTSDHKVIVDLADTTPNYLSSKLAAAGGIALNILNPAGNEEIEIDATNVPGDHKVLVDGSDTTPGYLSDKLAVTGSIDLTILNPAGDEQVNAKIGSFLDPRDEPYYARAGAIGTTCTTVGGNSTVLLTSSVLQAHDGACIMNAGPLTGFTTPSAPTAALGSGIAAGTTQREFKILAVGAKLGYTAASPSVSIANAPDVTGVTALTLPYVVDTESPADIPSFSAVPTSMNGFDLVVGAEFLQASATSTVNNGVYTVTVVNGSTCVAIRSAAWAAGGGLFPAAAKNTGIYVKRGVTAGFIYRVLTFGTIGVNPITFGSAPYVDVTPLIVDVAIRLSANVPNLAATPKTWTVKSGTYTLQANDLVGLTVQTATAENGFYRVQSVGATAVLVRDTSYDTAAELPQGLIMRAMRDTTGTSLFDFNALGGSIWTLTSVVVTVGVDPITFAQQDIRWFAVYARTGGSGNYVFRGAICANPYWEGPTTPFPVVYRDYGGKMTLQGYGWASSSHIPVNGRLPLNAPAVEGASFHQARVVSVAPPNIVLDVAPTTSAVGTAIRLDNYQAITDAIASFGVTNSGGQIYIHEGLYQVYGDINIDKNIALRGVGKKGNSNIQFGDGFNVRFLGNVQTSGGTTSEGSTLYGIQFTCENRSLPQGARYARSNLNDPLNRAPAYGVAIHIQATNVAVDDCTTRACGSAMVYDGRDSSGSLADECKSHGCDFGGSANGHGVIATGANANANDTKDFIIDGIDGDAIIDASFLNNNWEDYEMDAAIGFLVRTTVASRFIGGYHEDTYGTVLLTRNAVFQPMFCVANQINPNSYTGSLSPNVNINNIQSPTRFAKPNGNLLNVYIAEPQDNTNSDDTFFRVSSDTADPRLKLDHYAQNAPSVANDGAGALTYYWKASAYVGRQWQGANPKGSGLDVYPRGFLVRDQPGGLALRRVRYTLGYPSAFGWYQKGDIIWDLRGGFTGTKYETLFWTVTAEFGIASVAWSAGEGVSVGDLRSSGNRVWLVQSVADNAEGGTMGGSPPTVGANFSTQVNGTVTLYQLPDGTDAAQVPTPFADATNPSPLFNTVSAASNLNIGANVPLNKWTTSSTADISALISASGAKYGNRVRLRKTAALGPKHCYVTDVASGVVVAVIPTGTYAGVDVMWDGTGWIVDGGYGIDMRFRNEDNRTDLAAIVADIRAPANFVKLSDDLSQWNFNAASTASDATGLTVVTPGAGNGRWERSDSTLDLKIAISKNTADATTLWTCPAGFRYAVIGSHWEVTNADWVGTGANGLSSSNTKFNTKGDLLGGPTGDTSAELTLANLFCGTAGPKINLPRTVLVAGDTIRYDLFGAAFTTGTGFAHIRLQRIP